MYSRITFENYRIFKNKQSLEIKPITVLFGKNNAGKTAVLQLPLLVANSFKSNSAEVIGQEFNQRMLYADIRDLIHNRANRALTIGLYDEENERALEYSFYVDNEKDVKSHIEKWQFSFGHKIDIRNDENHEGGETFDGVLPLDCPIKELKEIKELNAFVDYIGNVRAGAERDMRLTTLTECSGWYGEKGYAHLLNDSQTISAQLEKSISEWYQKTFPGWSIKVDSRNNPIFHVNVANGNVETNIVDAGFGLSQSLPIVIRACRPCTRPTLVVLEEPEAHLHPAAQGNLGELIAMSSVKDKNKHYLIETHSFNFILRLRALIASGKIKKEDIALYFVDYKPKEQCSSLCPVVIDDNGMVFDWPKGVFEETYTEVVNIRNAKMAKL